MSRPKLLPNLNETHIRGHVSLENPEDVGAALSAASEDDGRVDFGIQISPDGRVWICINGIAFLRFKPTWPPQVGADTLRKKSASA